LPNDQALALAKILLIQMRFPRIFDQLRAHPGTAAAMMDGLEHGVDGITALKQQSPQLGPLLDDAALARFLRNTSEIRLAPKETERWIRLAGAASQA
jgi:hypothetical protein